MRHRPNYALFVSTECMNETANYAPAAKGEGERENK